MFLPSNLHTGSYLKVPAPATAPQHWMGVAVRAGAAPSKQKRAAPASQNWPPSSSVLVQSQYCTCLTKKQRKLRFFFVAAFCIWHRLSSYYCLCNKLIQKLFKEITPITRNSEAFSILYIYYLFNMFNMFFRRSGIFYLASIKFILLFV